MSDDDEQNTLRRFGMETNEHKVPKVWREVAVWSPTDDDIPVGFVGRDRRRGVDVYTTRRKDYHYYREGGGWAISNSILKRLEKTGIERILIHTYEDGDVQEFLTRDYVDFGKPVPREHLLDENDPQRFVSDDEARNEWPGLGEEDLFCQSFSDAMDRITSKRGWD